MRRRRGDDLPARLRFAVHRGVTLVELMISMLILTIVCVSWFEIIGIQSAKKEARRREAVERLAGMMDAFMYIYRTTAFGANDYKMDAKENTITFERILQPRPSVVYQMFDDGVSTIGYQLRVVKMDSNEEGCELLNSNLFGRNWNSGHRWLVGRLFDKCGAESEAGDPFFSMSVFLAR